MNEKYETNIKYLLIFLSFAFFALGIILMAIHYGSILSKHIYILTAVLIWSASQFFIFRIDKIKQLNKFHEFFLTLHCLLTGACLYLIKHTYFASYSDKFFLIIFLLLLLALTYWKKSISSSIFFLTTILYFCSEFANSYWLKFIYLLIILWLPFLYFSQKDTSATILWLAVGLFNPLFFLSIFYYYTFTYLFYTLAIFIGFLLFIGTYCKEKSHIQCETLNNLNSIIVVLLALFNSSSIFMFEQNHFSFDFYLLIPIILFLSSLCLFLILHQLGKNNILLNSYFLLLSSFMFCFVAQFMPIPELFLLIIINIALLISALVQIINGLQCKSIWRINWGIGLIISLILLRFFDSDLTYFIRGLIFICLGIIFLTTNFYLNYKFKRH